MFLQALIDYKHKLRDVLSYHPTEVYQAESIFLMLSLFYLHLCLPDFSLCSYLLRYFPMSQICLRFVPQYKTFQCPIVEMPALKKFFIFRKSYSVYCIYLNLVRVCFHTFFEKSPTFSLVLHFLLSSGQGLLKCGLPSHLVHMLLLLLARNFSFGFRNVVLSLNPTSTFTVQGFLPDEKIENSLLEVSSQSTQ